MFALIKELTELSGPVGQEGVVLDYVERLWRDAGAQWYAVSGLDNKLQSLEIGPYAGVALRTTDEIYSRALFDYEDVQREFKIAGKVTPEVSIGMGISLLMDGLRKLV